MREVIVIDRPPILDRKDEAISEPGQPIAIFLTSDTPLLRPRGKAALYKLIPSYKGFERVVVSSIDALPSMLDTSETMIFGVGANNILMTEDELAAFHPAKSHASALFALGYKLI